MNAAPGFVDLHLHGAFGVDVTTADAAGLDRLAQGLAARGYAAFLPTLVPLAESALAAAVERLGAWIAGRREGDGRGALPLGVHFEGPFVAPERAGALDPRAFADGRDGARVTRFLRLVDALPGKHVATLAPEIPGGLELVATLARRGVVVALGHTGASFDVMERAVEAGARHLTHFCNAMRPLHHRDPGPIGFGLVAREVTLDVIADGVHLDRRMLELIFRVRGAGAVALISDAMPAAGLGDGAFTAWGVPVTVEDGVARTRDGAIAGSIALLDRGVEEVAALAPRLGIGRDAVLRCASELPRRILGLASKTGDG